jgi:hypothetical protein
MIFHCRRQTQYAISEKRSEMANISELQSDHGNHIAGRLELDVPRSTELMSILFPMGHVSVRP